MTRDITVAPIPPGDKVFVRVLLPDGSDGLLVAWLEAQERPQLTLMVLRDGKRFELAVASADLFGDDTGGHFRMASR